MWTTFFPQDWKRLFSTKSTSKYFVCSKDNSDSLLLQKAQMKESFKELDEFCEANNAWLHEIHQFCCTWNEASLLQWKDKPVFSLEVRRETFSAFAFLFVTSKRTLVSIYFMLVVLLQQKVNELRSWHDRIRNFERSRMTENGFFLLDCTGIHNLLIPRVTAALQDICYFAAEESQVLAEDFCQEMDTALAVCWSTFHICWFSWWDSEKRMANCITNLPQINFLSDSR